MADKPATTPTGLDEIFPKDVMERTVIYRAYDDENELICTKTLLNELILEAVRIISEFEIDLTIAAVSIHQAKVIQLARRRVRLSLNVEVIDDPIDPQQSPTRGEG